MYEYSCIVRRVVDGDTIDVDIDLGFGVWMHDSRIKLYGIDAPETRTRDLHEKEMGLLIKEKVSDLMPEGSHSTLRTHQFSRGKYGRIIGDFIVYDTANDRYCPLTELLLTQYPEMVEVYNAGN